MYWGMQANFRIEGRVDKLIDLLIWPDKEEEKKSKFCFKIFVGKSDELDTLFVSKLFISLSASVRDLALKEKLKLHFFKDYCVMLG